MRAALLIGLAGLLGAGIGEIVQARSGPVVSVAEVASALDQAGIVVGAGRTVNGVGYKIEQRQISMDGPWVVVRILPRRFP